MCALGREIEFEIVVRDRVGEKKFRHVILPEFGEEDPRARLGMTVCGMTSGCGKDEVRGSELKAKEEGRTDRLTKLVGDERGVGSLIVVRSGVNFHRG
jgi:hypothetical protein